MREVSISKHSTSREYAWLLAGLALLLAGAPARANQSRTWGACECEQDQYTLTVNTLDYGTFTKDPDKSLYSRGETVNVSFTPATTRRFVQWTCSPASNLASGFPLVSDTSVFITGDTTLTAETAPGTYMLTVYWDPTNGTVDVPEGAEVGQSNGLNWVRGDVPYGQEVTLNATPSAGYFTEWLGYVGPQGTDWSGYRFGDSVQVVLLDSDRVLQAAFSSCDDYPDPMYDNTVVVSGGAATVCSAYVPPLSTYGSGCYPELEAIGGPANSFSLVVYPNPLYSFTYLNWTDSGTAVYTTADWLSRTPGNTYTANVVPKIMLNVETEGQGVVTSNDFLAFYNPLPYSPGTYYGNPPTPSPGSNSVTMNPGACDNWAFDHWEYKDSGGNWVNGGSGNILQGNAFTIYMNWWTDNGIHVPSGLRTFSVKAAFRKDCLCGPVCYYAGGSTGFTPNEEAYILKEWHNIRLCNIYKTGDASGLYNCIAFVVGDYFNNIWDEVDLLPYGNGDGVCEQGEFVNYFNANGVSNYIIYGNSASEVIHAALSEGTCAESKLGMGPRMRHDAHELEGGVYGNILP